MAEGCDIVRTFKKHLLKGNQRQQSWIVKAFCKAKWEMGVELEMPVASEN